MAAGIYSSYEKAILYYRQRIAFSVTQSFYTVQEDKKEMEGQKVFGYIRVSTREQNMDRQRIALEETGIPPERIYMDRQSGKDFDRPQYMEMLKQLEQGSVLYVKSIDRLGRNYSDLTEQWRIITKEKGTDIVVLDMPLLDTRSNKDLLGTFISDIVLTLLSYVAENERANIRQRQAEGIAAARRRGIHFGRPSKPLPDNFASVYRAWKAGAIHTGEAAAQCGMPRSTFCYKAKRYEEK